jgi:DNA recombination protein RmuC
MTDILIMIMIGILILVFLMVLAILTRVWRLKLNQSTINKTIEDYKFNQQTYFMNMQRSITEDFNNLREQLLLTINRYNDQTIKELLGFQNKLTNELFHNFERLIKNINDSLDKINDRVDLRLNEGFEKTNKTFANVLERLSKIDEAQKKIESLSTNIISLQDVLTDKKARGTFGEVQLKHIFTSIFGEKNDKIYQLQKTLSNKRIVDAILHTPEPLGSIAIDSKFPLENYKRMVSRDSTELERNESERKFKIDVKNHINAIKEKYILPNETAESAIMFIPAEAVFAEINAYHSDLIEYAQKENVWIASPTTLMFLLTTVQVVLRNVERDKYASVIQEELNKLGIEFKRYKERWDKLSQNIDQVSKHVKDLHITSDKIEKHFDSISRVDIDAENKINMNYDVIIKNKEE